MEEFRYSEYMDNPMYGDMYQDAYQKNNMRLFRDMPRARLSVLKNNPLKLSPIAGNIIKGIHLTPADAALAAGVMLANERDQYLQKQASIERMKRIREADERLKNIPMELKADPRYENFYNRIYSNNFHTLEYPQELERWE